MALGRAIVAQAPVCLMDEPLSNLDAQLRAEMRREIVGLQRRLGLTMIYVTHDQVEAMSMADQVVLLRAGRLEQAAAPAEVYDRPASMFVAGFIGSPPMNLLPLEAAGGGLVIAGTTGPVLAPVLPERVVGGIQAGEFLRRASGRVRSGAVPAGGAFRVSWRRYGTNGRCFPHIASRAGAFAGPASGFAG